MKKNHGLEKLGGLNCGVPMILAVAMLAGNLAAATTHYVALHSGGTYDGTSWATAFTNVQEAVTAGGANGVVLIAGGTYALPAALTINQTNILVRGGYEGVGVGPGNHDPAQWPTTLSRGGASQRIVMVSGGHDTRLEHVSITGGNVNEGAGVRVEGSSQRVTLTGCTISNNVYSANSGNAHSGGGVYAMTGTSLTLAGCILRDNQTTQQRDSSGISQGGGIYSVGTLALRDTVIANNSLTHAGANKTRGCGLYFGGPSLDMQNVLVMGNFIYPQGSAGGIHIAAGTATLNNCTVVDHAVEGIYRAGSAAVSILNSIVWGNWGDIVGTVTVGYSDVGGAYYGGSNLQVDPGFEAGYYLAAGSPCIGAGSATATSLGLAAYARNVAGDTYGSAEIVNLGYHYGAGFPMPYPDLYVSTTGSDTLNVGTSPAQAFRSVTKALATAHADTRIHVEAGTYTRTTETFPLALSDKPGVAILGTNAALTRLDASGSTKRVMTLLRNHRLRLEGLTVTGGSDASGAGVYIDNSLGVQVTDCVIAKNQYTGKPGYVQGGGLYAGSYADVLVANCVIYGNDIYNQHDAGARAGGGGVWSSGRLALRDSIVTNNTVKQAYWDDIPGGSGLHFAGTRLDLVNSLVVRNQDNNRATGGVQIGSGTAEIANLTLVGNGTVGLRRRGGTVNAVNSILWGNGVDSTGTVTLAYSCVSNSTDYVDGGHNVTGNPHFAGANDYRLLENSSCVNQGLNQSWMAGAFDLAGERRIRAARVDIGAYEWVPPLGSLIVVH